MKKRKMVILLSVVGLIALLVSIWSYSVFKKRAQEMQLEDNEMAEEIENVNEESFDGSNDPAMEDGEEMLDQEEVLDLDEEDLEPIEIATADCENNCADFNDEEEDYIYCLEICGLASSEVSADCEKLPEASRDYCWKAQAVENTDLKLCEKIKDENIKKSCKNRVTEDIIEPENSLE